MDLIHAQGEGEREQFQAQSHLYKHVFNYIGSMSLKCAVQLGIPDIIYNHGQPITLPELVSKLQIHPSKAGFVPRLMRLLVHSGLFAATVRVKNQEEEEAYDLTPSSRVLIKDQVTPFESVHGMSFWDYNDQNPEFNSLFNEAMASDSGMMNFIIKDCKAVFEGLDTLVDVGGGTGTCARIISEEFPHLKCTVFDLPHVVANLAADSLKLNYVAGDMFESIPSADALLLKLVLHGWSDEHCVKILKKCREAISKNGKGEGKVIIIDVVINEKKEEHEMTEAKLLFDMLMMVVTSGKERDEKDFKKLFLEAGFNRYKITPIYGLRYVNLPHTTVMGFENNDKVAWVERIMQIDRRDIGTALSVISSNISAATFLASISLTLCSLIGAWMANSSNYFMQGLVYGDTRPSTMSIKYISLLICFLLAFSCFVQSARNFVHANYLLSTPDSNIPVRNVELVILRGGDFWSLGLRALYFALDILLWFFGPIPMFVSSIVMVIIFHYLDTNTTLLHKHGSPQKQMVETVAV
ncbi:trans-resveratrol di-O-methyltransferase-like isoform X2 [Carya illinoinensis]|uniref:trans-resveratrol di-O-methyltransferase-like isoform X2 n=1 Tax=Carya illinoinensis TaxID=32201 RepID=UPI001C72482E|nr:trans-resveratrol di-O-methyltransferase-like isoform X2 [Carya illinoinensis]